MIVHFMLSCDYSKVKCSRYRPGVTQRVGSGVALLFHDRGTRRGWVVSNTLRPHFTPEKEPVPIVQEAGWATGPVWTGGNSRPHRYSIPDRPARSQSLYRLSYRTRHVTIVTSVYVDGIRRRSIQSSVASASPCGLFWYKCTYEKLLKISLKCTETHKK